MALYLCRETFTGEIAPGVAKTFHLGVDVLDDAVKAEAALLKVFAIYFNPLEKPQALRTFRTEEPDADQDR